MSATTGHRIYLLLIVTFACQLALSLPAQAQQWLFISGNMDIVDDERGDDEHPPIFYFGPAFYPATLSGPPFEIDRCAGDEVRVEVAVYVREISPNREITAEAVTKLYEGASCDTNDLEKTFHSYPIRIPFLRSETISVYVFSDERNSSDRANVQLTIFNTGFVFPYPYPTPPTPTYEIPSFVQFGP